MNVASDAVSGFQPEDIIREVRREREDLARVLKKHTGIRKLVEDLYPDNAHFIYELLQNAEDAGATEANFLLTTSGLVFEHNGRAFEKKDVFGITDIGEGTKAGVDDKIGRFGVGFKAVFAYTETPSIWSPTYSFKIEDLVLPTAIAARQDIGKKTRFEFPFNNPKKPAHQAYRDIETGLRTLAEMTLLFLLNLQYVGWATDADGSGQIMRIQHADHLIEVLKESSGDATSNQYFLKFDQPVAQLARQQVSVAFALEFLPTVKAFVVGKALAKQFRIVETRGAVAVYFPAEKEASGLRFHLHAPFVPELSRASIKETAANTPLFDLIAELTASSLRNIREYGLLTAEFLAALPNLQDHIPPRYECIRRNVILAMDTEPLTPTHGKSHAPARTLLQAKASLKDLLSEADIEYLVEYEDEPPRWAIAATQKNTNADRFLASLAIKDWGVGEFADLLADKTSETGLYSGTKETDPDFMAWLAAKPAEWHQQLYALLNGELGPEGDLYRFENCRIVRLSDGSYGTGSKCFFPDDGGEGDESFPRVAVSIYSSGKSKAQQQNARTFLEEIGVRFVGETEQVEMILSQRYMLESEIPDEKIHISDLNRFISLVETAPVSARLFKEYFIFECEGEQWCKPSGVYIDAPFRTTGLSAFYGALGHKEEPFPLVGRYAEVGIELKRLADFAMALGARTVLAPSYTGTDQHPHVSQLRADWYKHRARWTDSAINRDWVIPGLSDALQQVSVKLSSLIWNTMCVTDPAVLEARFRPNQQYATNRAPSSLVLLLQCTSWIPQGDGIFVRPSQARRDLLPAGFPFDSGQAWLKALRWGEEVIKRSEQQRQKEAFARELGFADEDSLERARRFAALPPEDQQRILADQDRRSSIELPDHAPLNPARRAESVAAQAATAPDRVTEERTRSVSVGREAVKEDAAHYLRQQYTSDDHMICQVCKAPMPFKLDDGTDYFEKVEFLPNLRKRHYQNYLALCPNHAAMFKEANGSAEFMQDMFFELSGNELEVVLAQKDATIYFTRTHIADLQQVVTVDQAANDDQFEDVPRVQSSG